jgi:hypothetical protein
MMVVVSTMERVERMMKVKNILIMGKVKMMMNMKARTKMRMKEKHKTVK